MGTHCPIQDLHSLFAFSWRTQAFQTSERCQRIIGGINGFMFGFWKIFPDDGISCVIALLLSGMEGIRKFKIAIAAEREFEDRISL